MDKDTGQIVCEGGNSELVEVCFPEPKKDLKKAFTLNVPERPFEKIKHLYSKKPLRFSRSLLPR